MDRAPPDRAQIAPLITRPAAWRYRRTRFGSAPSQKLPQPRLVDLVRARWCDADLAELGHYWAFAEMRERAGGPAPGSTAASVGRLLGETLACFGLHVIGELDRLGAAQAWFLGRDAWLMLRAHRILRKERSPRGKYLAVSRVSSTHAGIGRYLDRAGFDRGVVLDIGWRGSIQDRLGASHGVYLCHAQGEEPKADRNGYLADNRRGDWLEHFVLRHYAVLECLCSAPHGSPVAYHDAKPVLGDAATPNAFVRQAQAEALATVRRWARVRSAPGMTAPDLRAGLLESWRRLLHHPSRAEAESLSSLVPDEPVLDPPPFDRLGGVAAPGPIGPQLERNSWPPGMLRLSRSPAWGLARCLGHEVHLARAAGEHGWR